MKRAIIIVLLIAQANSMSFYDVFAPVEDSLGRLVTDVVSDIRETIDCTLMAVESVFTLGGLFGSTNDYEQRCKGQSSQSADSYAGTGDTSTYVDTPNPPEEIVATPTEKEIIKDVAESVSDAKTSIQTILEQSDAQSKIEKVQNTIRNETERLNQINTLLRNELEKLPEKVRKKFSFNINHPSKLEDIFEEIKTLYELEQEDKSSAAANEVRRVFDKVLIILRCTGLDNSLSDKEQVKLILTLLGKSSDDVEKQVTVWTDEQDKNIKNIMIITNVTEVLSDSKGDKDKEQESILLTEKIDEMETQQARMVDLSHSLKDLTKNILEEVGSIGSPKPSDDPHTTVAPVLNVLDDVSVERKGNSDSPSTESLIPAEIKPVSIESTVERNSTTEPSTTELNSDSSVTTYLVQEQVHLTPIATEVPSEMGIEQSLKSTVSSEYTQGKDSFAPTTTEPSNVTEATPAFIKLLEKTNSNSPFSGSLESSVTTDLSQKQVPLTPTMTAIKSVMEAESDFLQSSGSLESSQAKDSTAPTASVERNENSDSPSTKSSISTEIKSVSGESIGSSNTTEKQIITDNVSTESLFTQSKDSSQKQVPLTPIMTVIPLVREIKSETSKPTSSSEFSQGKNTSPTTTKSPTSTETTPASTESKTKTISNTTSTESSPFTEIKSVSTESTETNSTTGPATTKEIHSDSESVTTDSSQKQVPLTPTTTGTAMETESDSPKSAEPSKGEESAPITLPTTASAPTSAESSTAKEIKSIESTTKMISNSDESHTVVNENTYNYIPAANQLTSPSVTAEPTKQEQAINMKLPLTPHSTKSRQLLQSNSQTNITSSQMSPSSDTIETLSTAQSSQTSSKYIETVQSNMQTVTTGAQLPASNAQQDQAEERINTATPNTPIAGSQAPQSSTPPPEMANPDTATDLPKTFQELAQKLFGNIDPSEIKDYDYSPEDSAAIREEEMAQLKQLEKLFGPQDPASEQAAVESAKSVIEESKVTNEVMKKLFQNQDQAPSVFENYDY